MSSSRKTRITRWGRSAPSLRWSLVWLGCVLLLAGCDQNSRRLRADEPLPPPPHPLAQQMGGTPGQSPAGLDQGTPPGISGTISILPELAGKVGPNAVLYVIARSGEGMPVAVKRLASPTFPVRFFLGQEAVMMPDNPLEGKVELTARIAQNGQAGEPEPGDLEGAADPNPVSLGSENVRVVIATKL